MDRITMAEIDQIEREAENYQLENYPISGVVLTALIKRLRAAEQAAEIAMPYLEHAIERAKSTRAHEASLLPRLGIMLGSIGAGFLATWFAASTGWVTQHDTLLAGIVFIVPFGAALIAGMVWLDRWMAKRMAAGEFDAKD
jgi:hypothetical protein